MRNIPSVEAQEAQFRRPEADLPTSQQTPLVSANPLEPKRLLSSSMPAITQTQMLLACTVLRFSFFRFTERFVSLCCFFICRTDTRVKYVSSYVLLFVLYIVSSSFHYCFVHRFDYLYVRTYSIYSRYRTTLFFS